MRKANSDARIFFFILFFGVLYLSYLVIRPLLSMLILALLIAVLFNPIYLKLKKIFRRSSIATTFTMLAVFLSFIIPITIISIISINQARTFINDIGEFAGVTVNFDASSEVDVMENTTKATSTIGELDVQKLIDDINEQVTKLPFVEEGVTIEEVRNTLGDVAVAGAKIVGDTALGFLSATPTFFTNLIVFIIILAALIPSLSNMKDFFLKLSPLDNDLDKLYLKKVQAMATSMVRGTFIIAAVQGTICGTLLLIAGVDYVIFWTLLCIVLSFIPNGAAIINWPIVVVLALTGNYFGAIVVLLGNLFLVGSVDNFLRPLLVSKEASLHPALTLVGVVGGLQVFGFLGFIYGPVILIFLVTTFDIYMNHYKDSSL